MKAFLVVVLAMLTCSSHARIGESLEKCVMRYGEVQAEHEGVLAFAQGEYVILCEFNGEKNTCDAITIGAKIKLPLTKSEIELILKENPGAGEWTLEDGQDARWKHSSGKWQAYFLRGMLSVRASS